MIKHLDCTFRDGGYYNNWEFPLEIVNEYLNSMVCAGIDSAFTDWDSSVAISRQYRRSIIF